MSRLGQIARGLGRFIPAEAVRPLGRPAAVFFHGVEHETLDPRLQQNHHETADFIAIARTLKADFDVLPLAALDDVLKRPERHSRALFLMSDDGYANTLGIAAGVLEELRLPWTLFVSTHHIDTGARNPVFLARLFAFEAPAGRYDLPNLPRPLILGEARDATADRLVWQLRALDMVSAQQAVDAMMAQFAPDTVKALLARFASETFLTWGQVRDLKGRGVEIGAHAHRHWPMNAFQSPAMLRQQAAEPRARIQAEVGRCRYFSYPFGNTGDISRDAWHAVRDAGYDYAFTTLSAALDSASNPFLLPRFALEPRPSHLTALISLLRAGNPRLSRWQRSLAG
jgi:peptidoglycan/xylan/chitin deacetylase (PgdA/CDA1 family)